MTWFRNRSPMRATEHSTPPHISRSGITLDVLLRPRTESLRGAAALLWARLAAHLHVMCRPPACSKGNFWRMTQGKHAVMLGACALGAYLAWSNARQISEPICFNRLPAYARRRSAADLVDWRTIVTHDRFILDGKWSFLHVPNDSASPAEVRSITVPGVWQAQFADLR